MSAASPVPAPARMVDPGGSALIGGVMMLAGRRMSAAVRLPDGSICVEVLPDVVTKPWVTTARRIPFVRGIAALMTSLSASVTALVWSARVTGSGSAEELARLESGRAARRAALAFSAVLSVAPFWAIHALLGRLDGGLLAAGLAEAGVRLGLLVGYVWAVGRWHRIADVFGYHGAEHKTISCYEAGDPLVPEVVARHSRFHPRCGTAFAFWAVVVVSAVGALSGDRGALAGTAVRIGALAVAVGVGYEIVRASARAGAAGRGRVLRGPGLLLQHLTTREPRLDQIETAVAALRSCAVGEQLAAIDEAIEAWHAGRAGVLATAAG